MDRLWTLVWLVPVALARLRVLRRLERQRRSRVITLIHRQESRSILGIPITRYIDIDDSEQVLRAIRMTPREMPIDLILHTPGGLVLATQQIAAALRSHPAKVTVIVPHHAMSGGTLLALVADEILMDPNAVMGPVDPQVGGYPAAALLKVDYPITAEQARGFGLAVRETVPSEVYALMDLYPQPRPAGPSVQYVPVPYRREPEPTAPRGGR
jgi:ClpP class serine protease